MLYKSDGLDILNEDKCNSYIFGVIDTGNLCMHFKCKK